MFELTVEFKEDTKFTGFSYQASGSFGGYSPKVAEVLFSKDGEKYTSYGTYQHPSDPWGALVQVGVNEYVTKFVKLDSLNLVTKYMDHDMILL